MKLLIGLLLLAAVAVFFFRRRGGAESAPAERKPEKKATDLGATTSQFHAVSIRPGPRACEAALGMQGQRFLSDGAPSIPLPACDAAACECRFVHFGDRRGGDDRRSPYPTRFGLEVGALGQEQRENGDRRRDPPA